MPDLFSADFVLSIAMLATVALIIGAIGLIRVEKDRRRGVLMLVAAIVLLINVLLIAWPR
jgi:carbon starvation protein CstA